MQPRSDFFEWRRQPITESDRTCSNLLVVVQGEGIKWISFRLLFPTGVEFLLCRCLWKVLYVLMYHSYFEHRAVQYLTYAELYVRFPKRTLAPRVRVQPCVSRPILFDALNNACDSVSRWLSILVTSKTKYVRWDLPFQQWAKLRSWRARVPWLQSVIPSVFFIGCYNFYAVLRNSHLSNLDLSRRQPSVLICSTVLLTFCFKPI